MTRAQLIHVYDTPFGFPGVRVRSRVGRVLAFALLAALFGTFVYVALDVVKRDDAAPMMQGEPIP
ncbi:MAG TPA: hypothetical protein VG755_01895 [Nannocystaceae bacterium]|nr:hypothetical protein [Nannocystaceae bacterium]